MVWWQKNYDGLVDVPRKGNVDRNPAISSMLALRSMDVPRKGNVDRNCIHSDVCVPFVRTFPARGTWIEILLSRSSPCLSPDVPRKGNVDRNLFPARHRRGLSMTFPARGTWIEMATPSR